MKKLSLLVALFSISCGGNLPPVDPGDTLDKICKLCPKDPTPPSTPTEKLVPQCSETLKSGCWVGDQYVSCPVQTDPCKNVLCPEGYTCKSDNFKATCEKKPVTPPDNPPPTNSDCSNVCPKALAPGAYVFMSISPYGNGQDSSPRVYGDTEFCQAIHGVPTNNCHLEGWSKRTECELCLMKGCPIWQFSVDNGKTFKRCEDNRDAEMSCDHFGDPINRDDPQTPDIFEGTPKACAAQKGEYGFNAGFFTIAHGKGQVKACLPDGTNCSRTLDVDY